jgi:S-adenosylmethionine:diacylglycerol 3-amino-3-carboxypropyl transferase
MADLSKNSTLFNDNIISESFAKLLVQQNKKEKAIEIYQKLMLKFPNKSAYFADLIKQLEEKNL